MRPGHIYLLADIEGSSGCFEYKASAYKTLQWAKACHSMSLDVQTAVTALFESGAESVTVRDFHRTCYNIFQEMIDPRAKLIQGIKMGDIVGMGNVKGHDTALFIGMHSSGGSKGFLAHTLTSRYSSMKLNDRLLPEIELFAGMLSLFGIKPLFFSGCPVACAEASSLIPGIQTYEADKLSSKKTFEPVSWRQGLYESVKAAMTVEAPDYKPLAGEYRVELTMRDGVDAAHQIGKAWKLDHAGNTIRFTAQSLEECYTRLMLISYLKPYLEPIAPAALGAYNAYARMGLDWARKKEYYLDPAIYHMIHT